MAAKRGGAPDNQAGVPPTDDLHFDRVLSSDPRATPRTPPDFFPHTATTSDRRTSDSTTSKLTAADRRRLRGQLWSPRSRSQSQHKTPRLLDNPTPHSCWPDGKVPDWYDEELEGWYASVSTSSEERWSSTKRKSASKRRRLRAKLWREVGRFQPYERTPPKPFPPAFIGPWGPNTPDDVLSERDEGYVSPPTPPSGPRPKLPGGRLIWPVDDDDQ